MHLVLHTSLSYGGTRERATVKRARCGRAEWREVYFVRAP